MRKYVGKKIGRLIVIAELPRYTYFKKRKFTFRRVLCRCDCGTEKEVILNNFISGRTQSCGCLFKEIRTKHGLATAPIYAVWNSMVQRCKQKNHPQYYRYGGRGIHVCEEWKTFKGFYADMGKSYQKGLVLDREDNDKGYKLSNCRWATYEISCNNKSNNKKVCFKGETLGVSQWDKKQGFPRSTMSNRLRRGWPIKKALFTPLTIKKHA